MQTAAWLDAQPFDPLIEHVPGLITEGFTILAGAPKAGKSWMADSIALSCAQGGTALGALTVEPRHVLLLALEDGERRLQSRLRKLNYGQPLPARLDIFTQLPGVGGEMTLLALMAEWPELHQDDKRPPLVILDTLAKERSSDRAGADKYVADYQFSGRFKAAIDNVPGAALTALHHTRKMEATDWLSTVSGSQGIVAAADSILILSRDRKSAEGILAVTGRDIYENEYAVRTDNGIWTLDGMDIDDAAATVETRREKAEQEKATRNQGDRSAEALAFVASRETTTPAELAQHLEISSNAASVALGRLLERDLIAKTTRGKYTPKPTSLT
jgi:RecA-family ATPase